MACKATKRKASQAATDIKQNSLRILNFLPDPSLESLGNNCAVNLRKDSLIRARSLQSIRDIETRNNANSSSPPAKGCYMLLNRQFGVFIVFL